MGPVEVISSQRQRHAPNHQPSLGRETIPAPYQPAFFPIGEPQGAKA
jgi:hypothetical protein